MLYIIVISWLNPFSQSFMVMYNKCVITNVYDTMIPSAWSILSPKHTPLMNAIFVLKLLFGNLTYWEIPISMLLQSGLFELLDYVGHSVLVTIACLFVKWTYLWEHLMGNAR